ncbi:hypothetical protein HMPREF0185_00102 [Brevundimonas diminuta 470-4]|nr:hypothetical protein HMPREF0185_00102 [Brevundimonas diminuta 470-4]
MICSIAEQVQLDRRAFRNAADIRDQAATAMGEFSRFRSACARQTGKRIVAERAVSLGAAP